MALLEIPQDLMVAHMEEEGHVCQDLLVTQEEKVGIGAELLRVPTVRLINVGRIPIGAEIVVLSLLGADQVLVLREAVGTDLKGQQASEVFAVADSAQAASLPMDSATETLPAADSATVILAEVHRLPNNALREMLDMTGSGLLQLKQRLSRKREPFLLHCQIRHVTVIQLHFSHTAEKEFARCQFDRLRR